MNRLSLGLLAALLLVAPAHAQEKPGKKKQRSVIYFIGDGMGASQVTLGRIGAKQLGKPYAFDRFEVVGLQNTSSADMTVTDSAASATALACGVKTNNKMVGMLPDKTPVESVLDAAHSCGLMTGLVTTARITHATPACFASHVPHRSKNKAEDRIAQQLSTLGYPEVLIGGGLRHFNDELLGNLTARGYAIETDPAKLMSAKPRTEAAKGEGYGLPARPRLAGLISSSHVPYKVDGELPRATLVDMTRKAVDVLAQGGPFFLMVEGGRVDHGCHAHDAGSALHEQLELAEAIDWALDRAARDPNLLIVVTADHATGALGIGENVDIDGLMKIKGSSEHLTSTKQTDEELQARIKAAYGFELTPEELAIVRKKDNKYWGRTALGHIASARFGVHFFPLDTQQEKMTKTHGHDGAFVPVYAFGPEAERFSGFYENVEIPKKIVAILNLDHGVPSGSALKAKDHSKKK